MFAWPLFQLWAFWFSSNELNVLPVCASRVKARLRKVFGAPETLAAEVLHAASRLSLLGVTPPAFVVKPQRPGSVSLSPPMNIESSALGSKIVGIEPASDCQSMSLTPSAGLETSPTGFAWLPSPPWKLLPESGALLGVSAEAEVTPSASTRAH